MGKQQKTFKFSDDLKRAQEKLAAVQAERREFLASLPLWGGDLERARQGLSEEQLAESARLEEAERQASHAVWADEFWGRLPAEDRVEARSQLKHVNDPVEDPAASHGA